MELIFDLIVFMCNVKLIYKIVIESRQQYLEYLFFVGMNIMYLLFSGSSEEGLYFFDFFVVRKLLYSFELLMIFVDKDIMIVWGNWLVNEEFWRKIFVVLEVKDIYFGYCWFCFNLVFFVSLRIGW